jgi:hypothetical protein
MSKHMTVAITAPISDRKLADIKAVVDTVHYYPDGDVPDDISAEVEIWFTTWTGFPASITSVDQLPKTRMIQLSSGTYTRSREADGWDS